MSAVVEVRSNSRIRQDLRRAADILVRPYRLRGFERRELVGRVGVGVDEHDGERFRARGERLPGRRAHLVEIDRLPHGAVRQHALRDLEAQVALDDGHEIAPQAPGVEPVAAAHFQHVAEARRGDERGARALALQKRVGADGRAVDDGAERRDRPEAPQPFEEAHGLVAAVRGHLGRLETPRIRVVVEQVGEGPADIDADDGGGAGFDMRVHAAAPSRSWRVALVSRLPSASVSTP